MLHVCTSPRSIALVRHQRYGTCPLQFLPAFKGLSQLWTASSILCTSWPHSLYIDIEVGRREGGLLAMNVEGSQYSAQ